MKRNKNKNDKEIRKKISFIEYQLDLLSHLLIGSILIFLPGYDEITTLRDKLMDDKEFSKRSSYMILLLHSMIAPSNQRKVFSRPPKGMVIYEFS